MNNNDPMKRFGYIVFSICLFALSACTSHEQMDQEEGIVKVSMGLTAASFTDDDATTRAEQPMAPDYENLISNLWILQFDREGILTGSEHKVLPTPVLNTTLEGIALRTGRGTVCVVGNLADGEIAAWPDNLSGFKSLVVDMGWLKERSTDRNVCLFGYYEGEIAAGTTAVNVVLGRLVCRLNIAVSAKTAGIFSNVKIQLQNAQTKGYLFPSDVYLSPEGGGNYTEEVVIGDDKVLGTAPLYRYYYMAENVTEGTDSGERTRLQIKAKKGGAEYTKAIDLGRSDIHDYSLRRNNNYTFNIVLE